VAQTSASAGWKLRVWQIGEHYIGARVKRWTRYHGWFPRRKIVHETRVSDGEARSAASQLGKRGRAKNSGAQQEASRNNGRKGGRPPGS
jgi:hypothetical protein